MIAYLLVTKAPLANFTEVGFVFNMPPESVPDVDILFRSNLPKRIGALLARVNSA